MAQVLKKKQPLPAKENNLFKSIVRHYESKQYKKGIKAADTILKKFPEHGETLAMKGLMLNCMEKKKEAYEIVRKGLKYDLTSHVSWHVYGLLYRSDRDYNEAIKCYRNALKNDKDNRQILRDLALLQVHLRDIEGFLETRKRLLLLNAGMKTNWISFAVGNHLNKNYTKALKILDDSADVSGETSSSQVYEDSELILYKNMIIEESGDFEKALEHLKTEESKVVDKLYVKEKRAELSLKLKQNDVAEKQYRELLKINPDSIEYHQGLLASLGLTLNWYSKDNKTVSADQKDVERMLSVYSELAQEPEFKYSDSVTRIPLDFVEGDQFKQKLNDYVIIRLRKGIPSLFVGLKSLYNDPKKIQVIQDLFQGFTKSLTESSTFNKGDSNKESPQSLFWTRVYLAQHYDQLGETELALKEIDEAIKHTPTALELYSIRGKILKHAGDLPQASYMYDRAREMDLADRYLNTKCARHQLRADLIDDTFKTISLFTKENEDPVDYLVDMQCMWFEQELGDSYLRTGDIGRALKKYVAIEKQFGDILEDQFDFHSYSIRKMTLRAYIHMLRLEDRLHEHKYYVNGAKSLLKCYIKLFDNPIKDDETIEKELLSKMTSEEKKKYNQKKAKETKKKADAEAEKEKAKLEANKKAGNKPSSTPKVVDPDPAGKLLIQTPDKLGASTKLIEILRREASFDIEVHLLSCEVYLRRKKYLLVLKALKKAQSMDPDNAELHRQKIKFFSTVTPLLETLPEVVRAVIQSEKESLVGSSSLLEFNKTFLDTHKSLEARNSAALALFALEPSRKNEAIDLIKQSEIVKGRRSLHSAIKNYETIKNELGDEKAAEEYRVLCKKHFPYAFAFKNEAEKKEQAEGIAKLKQPQNEKKEETPKE